MGDMADELINDIFEADWQGAIDMKTITCKYCGRDGFHWGNIGTEEKPKWRLFDSEEKIHLCGTPGGRKIKPKPTSITEFKGEYRFLSNFYPATVDYEGIRFPTVEHAFQAAKTLDKGERRRISKLGSAGEAKRAGRKVTLRRDWEKRKIEIMSDLVYQKFSNHSELREKLLDTGNAKLVEGNNWHDTFWGVDVVSGGENHLGKILMEVRAQLKED